MMDMMPGNAMHTAYRGELMPTCIDVVQRRRDDEAAALLAAAIGCALYDGVASGCPVKPPPPVLRMRSQWLASTGCIGVAERMCLLELPV